MGSVVPASLKIARRPERDEAAAIFGPWLAAGLVAAAGAYALHHIRPLADHALLPVALGVALATTAAVLAARATAARHHPALPIIVSSAGAEAKLRCADRSDRQFGASLHAQSLPHGFFVALGPGFLRAYYATFIDSPHAVALITEMHGHRVGLAVGALRPQAHVRWVIRRRGARLGMLAGLALLSRPAPGWRFIRTRVANYRGAWRRHRNAEPHRSSGNAAVLSHIAVLPGARGLGLGTILIGGFVDAARDAEIKRAVLTTLDGPAGAGEFYERSGWRCTGARADADGRRIRCFALDLQTGPD